MTIHVIIFVKEAIYILTLLLKAVWTLMVYLLSLSEPIISYNIYDLAVIFGGGIPGFW